jgi:hypothetical protein
MKLYELTKGDHFKITDKELRTPPTHDEVNLDDIYWFGNIDGMYSFCKDSSGKIIHFAAWTEVEVVNGLEMSSTTST